MENNEILQSIYYIIASIAGIITIIKFFNWDSYISFLGSNTLFSIPWFGYFLLFVIVVGLLIWSHQRGGYIPSSRFVVVSGGIDEYKLCEIRYKGVIWNIMAPTPSKYDTEGEYKRKLPKLVSVSYFPRCPHCKIELEERENLILGYNWHCIGCGFKKWNKDNISLENERVEKIARSECEKDLENK